MHILIETSNSGEAEVERSIACCATAIDQAVFVATDLEKYTSLRKCNYYYYYYYYN